MTTTLRPFGRVWALAAGVSLLALPGLAHATVVWTAGFEANKSGDVCASMTAGAEFIPGAIVVNNGRTDAEVLGEQVYAGKLACKVTVHPDDIFGQYKQDRVDVKHVSTLSGEGKDMYLSGHYYLPADAQTRDEFGMFETMKSLNWIDIWIEPKTGGGTTIKLGIESNGANLGSVPVWSGDLSIGTWHQIAIHVLFSQDATKGSLVFWLDGKQVVPAFKHKTRPDGTDLYFLTGLHRVLMQPYTESIYFDDFIEGDAQTDIEIGAPGTGSGTADGGTDATQTTGAAGAGAAAGSGGAGTSGARRGRRFDEWLRREQRRGRNLDGRRRRVVGHGWIQTGPRERRDGRRGRLDGGHGRQPRSLVRRLRARGRARRRGSHRSSRCSAP